MPKVAKYISTLNHKNIVIKNNKNTFTIIYTQDCKIKTRNLAKNYFNC